MKAIRLTVTGKVQDVFFRASTKEIADQIGIHGWVRNRHNGTVEVHAEGKDDALETLINWCHEGPEMAEVKQVNIKSSIIEKCTEFIVRHTI